MFIRKVFNPKALRLLVIAAALALPLAWSATASAESGCHRNGGNGTPSSTSNGGK